MADVAIIKLHLPFAEEIKQSRDRYISAAQSVSVTTKEMLSGSAIESHVNPILGVRSKLA